MQIDPCTSVWTRNREGEFVPLWFNGQQFPDELMKPAKQKAPVTQNPVCNEEKPSKTMCDITIFFLKNYLHVQIFSFCGFLLAG